MIQLVYISAACRPFEQRELAELLYKSRRNNERLDVTGMLAYHDRIFLQVLEGKRSTVEALYERIKKDPRHQACETLLSARIERRSFEDWSMGFTDEIDLHAQGIVGYRNFADDGAWTWELTEDATTAVKILKAFRGAAIL